MKLLGIQLTAGETPSSADERALRPRYIYALACMLSLSPAILDPALSLLSNDASITSLIYQSAVIRQNARIILYDGIRLTVREISSARKKLLSFYS